MTTVLKKESTLFWLFILLAASSPLLAFLSPWVPDGDTRLIWTLRSGGIMAIFAMLAGIFSRENKHNFIPINNLFSATFFAVGFSMLIVRDMIK